VKGQTAKKVEASTAPPGQKNPGGGLSEKSPARHCLNTLTDWKGATFDPREQAVKIILKISVTKVRNVENEEDLRKEFEN
jgi:hypothetical protein